jgi:hypothetical protein
MYYNNPYGSPYFYKSLDGVTESKRESKRLTGSFYDKNTKREELIEIKSKDFYRISVDEKDVKDVKVENDEQPDQFNGKLNTHLSKFLYNYKNSIYFFVSCLLLKI